MLAFIKDIRFCEQMNENGFEKTFCLTLIDDDKFYAKKGSLDHVYQYFRNEDGEKVQIEGSNKLESDDEKYNDKASLNEKTIYRTKHLKGTYQIDWQKVIGDRDKKYRYYLLEAQK